MWIAERAELVSLLDRFITRRLFGSGKWLGDPESDSALVRLLRDLNLEEEICSDTATRRNTALGNELDMDLLAVFLGLWNPWDAVMILEDFELIDEIEARQLYSGLAAEKDPERLMRTQVQAAYLKYFGLRVPN